ncbi:MAG: retropepsin-like aspartic protease [Verrucomicrobiaceae bacterium]
MLQNGQQATIPIARFSEADQDVLKKWSKLRDNLARSKEFRRMTVRELLELRGYQSFQYRIDGNHILVDGMLNNTKTRYLIDTGAHGGVLHSEFGSKAGAEIGPFDQWIYGVGGKSPAANAVVKSLKIGDVVLKDRTMLAADLFKDQQILAGQRNYDAIFGADFLRELDAVVNYKENRIFLRPDNSDAAPKTLEKPAEEKKAGAS